MMKRRRRRRRRPPFASTNNTKTRPLFRWLTSDESGVLTGHYEERTNNNNPNNSHHHHHQQHQQQSCRTPQRPRAARRREKTLQLDQVRRSFTAGRRQSLVSLESGRMKSSAMLILTGVLYLILIASSNSQQANRVAGRGDVEAGNKLQVAAAATLTEAQQQQQQPQPQPQLKQVSKQPEVNKQSEQTTTTTTTREATTIKVTEASSSDGVVHSSQEFQRYDGWYNNLANADWGTPNTRLRRKAAPAYSDGVYQLEDATRPSARLLSQRMMRGDDGLASRRNLTTLFAFFGQVISSEILMASESGCPIEMHRIKIERCDPMYDRDCRGGRTMPFYRAAYDPSTGQSPNLPREQLNRVTSWIDGSFIYSTSETWLNTMRSFDGRGTLKMAPSGQMDNQLAAAMRSGHSQAGDAHLQDLMEAMQMEKASGGGQSSAKDEHVPMSLFGYPIRNKQRAPLINHMPAHHLQMKKAERMFLLGDARTNQNPMLLTFGIIFYRWHNVLAERIHREHPNWSDEEIFQRARRLVIASLQNIFLYEFLPVLLDTPSPYQTKPAESNDDTSASSDLVISRQASASQAKQVAHLNETLRAADGVGQSQIERLYASNQLNDLQYDAHDLIRPYSGYKPDLHPGISHAFQSSAFRFGHTMIPPGLYLRDDKCRFLKTPQGFKGVRLCSTWWNAEEVVSKVGVEQLLMGAASQIAEREDYVLCNDVRDKLYGPLDFSRRDLAALNIMRGRDNGLADYNTIRQAYRLPRVKQWRDINPRLYDQQPKIFEDLAELYGGRLDRVDLYIGGMLESDIERGRPGPLFRRIIKEQFERLRDSDRFWFENLDTGIFSETEIEEIKRIKLYDIIVNSTLIPEEAIQRNVFQHTHSDPCPQPGQLSSKELQPCYIVKGHNYFKGNEQTYLLVCVTLVVVPILCMLFAYLVVEHQDRKRRKFKTKQEYERNLLANSSSNHHLGNPAKGHTNKSFEDDEDQSGGDHDEEDQNELGPKSRKREQKCEKIYAKEWLHSNLKRKIKLRLGPEPDETLYVLDGEGRMQRKLDLSQAESSSVVVELSSSQSDLSGGGLVSLGCPPRHPLQASPTTSNLSLLSSSLGQTNEGSSLGADERRRPSLDSSDGTTARIERSSSKPLESIAQQLELVAGSSCRPLTADELDQPVDHKPMVLIRVARNYDLVLQFVSVQHRRKFIFKLQAYLSSIQKSMILYRVQRDIMLANAETKEKRKQRLEQFFREAYALTFGLDGGGALPARALTTEVGNKTASGEQQQRQPSEELAKMSPDISMVMRTSLSRLEFAEALGMRSDSLFVRQMFNCIDKDRNGQISFQEFLDLVARFSRGQQDDKLRIVFDMCDHNGRGLIEKRDLVRMLRSLVDMAKTKSLDEQQVQDTIEAMFESAGLAGKRQLNYDDFKLIMSSTEEQRQSPLLRSPIGLDMKGAKRNFFSNSTAPALIGAADQKQTRRLLNDETDEFRLMRDQPATTPAQLHQQRRMTIVDTASGLAPSKASIVARQDGSRGATWWRPNWLHKLNDKWKAIVTELEEHRQDIVYLLMFFVIVVVLFLERFISYSFLSEHMDLRHVMGFGIAITRGSAASLSFCYAMLLLSMCRNLQTWIRSMSVREYIPLDSHVKFHKIVAITALVMTLAHTIGHCVNFYHVTQQPVEHLRCLTKEMQFSGESRPTFFYWIFQTVTGTTGLLLWILCSILYVFAHQQVRQRAYSWFWSTHKLYYLIYALTLLHGSSKLTGSPRFWIFFIIPACLFTIDKIISLQAKLWQLEIFETELLPSDVIAVKFARPPSFKFLSGQWVRVACTAFRPNEFHAFTLTSAPQDDFLSVHVRAQGPWTWKLRNLFDPINLSYHQRSVRLPPRIRIEGPFGGGNQDWCKYEVAVMIGGGIGVTPYASILNDLVYSTSTSRYSSAKYKKVYFIWICPSHRNFEWFIDVLREVERRDTNNLLEMHIFITQFFHKFDLRTTMLYICENHFKQISNKSLFTGLKAANHFGRPDIAALLEQVQSKHAAVNKVGVFSCGPKPLTKSVTEACEKVNKRRKLPFFLHQYENFS